MKCVHFADQVEMAEFQYSLCYRGESQILITDRAAVYNNMSSQQEQVLFTKKFRHLSSGLRK